MLWGKAIVDHHRSIEYAETLVVLDIPFTVQREPDGKRLKLVVSGHCPACGGLMAKEFSYGIVGSKGFRRPGRPSAPSLERVTMYCECGHLHPDKPATALDDGCGRYWKVDLATP